MPNVAGVESVERIRSATSGPVERTERAGAPLPDAVPPGTSNAALARWATTQRGRALQRAVTVRSGLQDLLLDPLDRDRSRRGDTGNPGAVMYGLIAAGLTASARGRLDDWIADGTRRRFGSQLELTAALKCCVEITDLADFSAINWRQGLGAWAATQVFQDDTGRDIGSLARARLKHLIAGPDVTRFATRAELKDALVVWAKAQLTQMQTAGVRAQDLDVAIAMYARLDQAGQGAEAILHKLEFAHAHHGQYQARGVNEATASNTGLVYGPWRAPGAGAPTAGPQQGAGSRTSTRCRSTSRGCSPAATTRSRSACTRR